MDVRGASFTRADYMRLPEGFPAELIHGDLVKEPSPSPLHQTVVTRLVLRLAQHVAGDLVLAAPVDVVLDEHNVFQPDVVVLRRVAWALECVEIPRIAFEVVSPSTTSRDRTKREVLIARGVDEVWLVHPGGGWIERTDANGTARARGEERLESRAIDGFALVPAHLFAPP
jgi:Uma2 family endonuclease